MRPNGKVSSSSTPGPARSFLWGAGCLAAGYRLLLRPGLRRFVAVPLAVNTAIFTALLFWALFGAWSLALEFLDFPLGNRNLTFPEQRAWLRRHRPACLGFGTAVMLAALVPVLNFALMPASVAGATRLVVRLEAA